MNCLKEIDAIPVLIHLYAKKVKEKCVNVS